jgi:hypothetical protein
MRLSLLVVLGGFMGSLGGPMAASTTWVSPGAAHPDMVVLLRHAEKPVVGEHLSPVGWARAHALVPYLLHRYGARLAAVYAAQVDAEHHSPSYRPQETVTPLIIDLLAAHRGVAINISWPVGQEAQVAADLMRHLGYARRTVIVAWEHLHLPLIAAALGVPVSLAWPDRFDLVMEIDMTRRPPTCRWVPQMLMPGDSPVLPQGCRAS